MTGARAKPLPALRCPEWLAYVRTLPSVQSYKRPTVAHHPVGNRHSTLKCSDFLAIPLTDAEHKVLHDKGWPEWERNNGPQLDYSLATLMQAITSGVLKWAPDANLLHWGETAAELERAIREGELIFDKRAARYAA